MKNHKQYKIILLFAFLCTSLTLSSQTWIGPPILKIFTVPQLEITDSLFLKGIDSLIIKSDCPVLKKQKGVFSMRLKKQKGVESSFLILTEYLPSTINSVIGDYGYFVFKGHLFLVSGENPNRIFTITPKKRKFSYKEERVTPTKEFPTWAILYKKDSIVLSMRDCW